MKTADLHAYARLDYCVSGLGQEGIIQTFISTIFIFHRLSDLAHEGSSNYSQRLLSFYYLRGRRLQDCQMWPASVLTTQSVGELFLWPTVYVTLSDLPDAMNQLWMQTMWRVRRAEINSKDDLQTLCFTHLVFSFTVWSSKQNKTF